MYTQTGLLPNTVITTNVLVYVKTEDSLNVTFCDMHHDLYSFGSCMWYSGQYTNIFINWKGKPHMPFCTGRF
jgi:hypothetical protein